MTKVIKLGGSLLDDSTRRATALADIVARWNRGEQIALVHGGGKHVDAMLARLGIPKRTHAGLRITDAATLDVVVAVLAGSVNKMLVGELAAMGVRAAGIAGCDASTLVAVTHEPIDGVDLGHVGRVVDSNPTLVRSMLTYGTLPVISSVAISAEGKLLNVNADSAASALAVSLRATSLQFRTVVEGVLDANGDVIASMSDAEAEAIVGSPVISGGMLPKLHAALGARSVPHITIGATVILSRADGEGPHGTLRDASEVLRYAQDDKTENPHAAA